MGESFLEADYMTMLEEYIHSEAERRARDMVVQNMAKDMAQDMARDIAKDMAKDMAQDIAKSKMASIIVSILSKRGTIPEELKRCIEEEKDYEKLSSWLELAAQSDSIQEFQTKM